MKRILPKIFRKKVNLIDMMPPLQGKVLENEPLKKKNWLGVGGPATVYVEPADEKDLSTLIRFMPMVPLTVLGAGSNLLIRDGGIPGIVVHLGKPFMGITVDKAKGLITCGAGAMMMELARVAERNGLAGFEFMCGIPGTLGGGIRMNAGAYGRSLKDVIVSVHFMTGQGDVKEIKAIETEMFGYRKCFLPNDWIFLGATMQGVKTERTVISQKMADYKLQRKQSQPMGVKTAGSTFKNPTGLAAWRLIEKAGMRGVSVGDAVVSDKHANFLVNKGNASAKDLEDLGERIRKKVWETSGVDLEWEIKRVGVEDGAA